MPMALVVGPPPALVAERTRLSEVVPALLFATLMSCPYWLPTEPAPALTVTQLPICVPKFVDAECVLFVVCVAVMALAIEKLPLDVRSRLKFVIASEPAATPGFQVEISLYVVLFPVDTLLTV